MLPAEKPMPDATPLERRKVRRRLVNYKAKAALKWDDPTPCIVRNISSLGALLEFTAEVADIPKRFRIAIQHPLFTAECELRHHTPTTAGVMFISNRSEASRLFG